MTVQAVRLPDFRYRGACTDTRKVPLDLHYPVGNPAIKNSPAQLQAAEAKAVCRRCPVADLCLQWAFDHGETHGVWGGMTEQERRAYRRRNAERANVVDLPEPRQADDTPATVESGTKLQEVAA